MIDILISQLVTSSASNSRNHKLSTILFQLIITSQSSQQPNYFQSGVYQPAAEQEEGDGAAPAVCGRVPGGSPLRVPGSLLPGVGSSHMLLRIRYQF